MRKQKGNSSKVEKIIEAIIEIGDDKKVKLLIKGKEYGHFLIEGFTADGGVEDNVDLRIKLRLV